MKMCNLLGLSVSGEFYWERRTDGLLGKKTNHENYSNLVKEWRKGSEELRRPSASSL